MKNSSGLMVFSVKSIICVIILLVLRANIASGQLYAGYPDRNEKMDVWPGFVHPPKGYGEVPFYWWQGDTLTKERITWQLDQLQGKGITSLQINYSHLDEGGLFWGLSRPSKPALFTPEWWELFKWFATEAKYRGMTVSLSDYTLGIGQGFAMDAALAEYPEMNGSELKYKEKILSGTESWNLPPGVLSLNAYEIHTDSSIIAETKISIMDQVTNNVLTCDLNSKPHKVVCVYAEKIVPSYDPMNPLSGKAYISHFFGLFENMLGENASALNFFFSDELDFRLHGNSWNNNFAGEFKKRKGYDLLPYLDALFLDIGYITPKIRLDFNDVLVSLSEENFFKPVYQWHQDRGLIYGCDHGGRGRNVAEFGDYFRTQRWNLGPGSDQPNLQKDIIKAKVASSIAHLYERPRVWLEGF